MLAHFASDPKMIGMGPINITPPPLTRGCLSPSPPSPDPFADMRVAKKTTKKPARMITIPMETRSNSGITSFPPAVSYISSLAVSSGPDFVRVQVLREVHAQD